MLATDHEATRLLQALLDGGDNVPPEETASLLSKATFTWVWQLIRTAWQRPLHGDDVWDLGPRDSLEANTSKFDRLWAAECTRGERGGFLESGAVGEHVLVLLVPSAGVGGFCTHTWK